MMKSESFGTDAPFVDGAVTPFVSPVAKIFEAAEKEAFPKESRGGSSLKRPAAALGLAKGRLDRLYMQYATDQSEDNLNLLLVEVERYASRVTTGKGGALARYLTQSPTDQYSVSEISAAVVSKVWLNLKKFKSNSKFSVWVFRIARNSVKDKCLATINRREVDFLEWKDYENEGSGCYRGASGEPADCEFEVVGGAKSPLPTGLAPDVRRVKLDSLLLELSGQDQAIINFVRGGYKPSEIGEEFGKNAKWASNQLNRIKKTLKKLAEARYPKVGVAKRRSSNVLVMKDNDLPASQAA